MSHSKEMSCGGNRSIWLMNHIIEKPGIECLDNWVWRMDDHREAMRWGQSQASVPLSVGTSALSSGDRNHSSRHGSRTSNNDDDDVD